jgi:hypothetical protein
MMVSYHHSVDDDVVVVVDCQDYVQMVKHKKWLAVVELKR